MKIIGAALLLLLLLLPLGLCASPANADGLMWKGHVRGPHTDLTLTAEQSASLKKGASHIELTVEQQQKLAHLPQAKGVKKLLILPKSTDTCTCELANVGVQIGPRKIEVADELLGEKSVGLTPSLEPVPPPAHE